MNDSQKEIFISYSKHDNRHKEALLTHLSSLRNCVIPWNDSDILAGEEWDARIKEKLDQVDVVLYLVSAHSIATEYINKIELPIIEARCHKGECVLVPIIVDFCYWEKSDFAKYKALPEKGIPVTNTKHWINEDQAWLKVIKEIEQVIDFKTVLLTQQPYLSHYAEAKLLALNSKCYSYFSRQLYQPSNLRQSKLLQFARIVDFFQVNFEDNKKLLIQLQEIQGTDDLKIFHRLSESKEYLNALQNYYTDKSKETDKDIYKAIVSECKRLLK